MATLKEHQNAMVDLLANGSAVAASTTRLAHAMHDVLGLLLERDSEPHRRVGGFVDSTKSYVVGETPLEAKLAADLSAAPPRGSVLIENLRAELAKVTEQRNTYKARCESLELDLEVTRAALKEVTDALALEGICLTNLLLRVRDNATRTKRAVSLWNRKPFIYANRLPN